MTVEEILSEFPKRSALIVGDICLDRWCRYSPDAAEPSRETGIPRIAVVSTVVTPGAGGTVANNLAALGAGRVAVLGATGDDGYGLELVRELEQRGIDATMLQRSPLISTFTYTKLINAITGAEDLPRVDHIAIRPLPEVLEHALIERLRACAPSFDVILVADQAETDSGGVVTPAVRDALTVIRRDDPSKVVWVDSRRRADMYRGVIVKPNEEEASIASRIAFGFVDFARLRTWIEAEVLFITLGKRGVLVVDANNESLIAARDSQAVDICGAGDAFSAGAAMALQISGSALVAARVGNLVASITITKRGTGTATPAEVLAAEKEWSWRS